MISYANRNRSLTDILDGIEQSIRDCRDEIDDIDVAPDARNGGSKAQECLKDISSDLADIRSKLEEIKEAI